MQPSIFSWQGTGVPSLAICMAPISMGAISIVIAAMLGAGTTARGIAWVTPAVRNAPTVTRKTICRKSRIAIAGI